MKNQFETYYNSIILEEKNRFAPYIASALLATSPMTDEVKAEPTSNQIVAQQSQFSNKNLPRGIRNNNPGNIEVSSTKWEGAVGDDGRFLQFAKIEWGIRAMGRILRTYETKYNLNTPKSIIYRYAPPKENDTEKYIKTVCQISGLKPDQKIQQGSLNQIALIHAMIIVENGRDGEVSKRTIGRGLSLINQTYKPE
jgi:hypothetical protein